MVTLYYIISQPLLTTIAIFEWIWITSPRIDGADSLEGNRSVRNLEKRFFRFFNFFTFSKKHISPEWLNRIKHNLAVFHYDIRYIFSDFCSTIHDGFRISWSSFTFVQLSRHTACDVLEIPQPTRKYFKLCKEKSVVCKALHQYVWLIYHKLHIYCLYVNLTNILRNIPTYSTGNEQLQQKHAHESLLSEGVVHTSSPNVTNWSTLRMLCERYVVDRCKRLYVPLGCGGAFKWSQRTSNQCRQLMPLFIAAFIWKPVVSADNHGPKIIANTSPGDADQNSPGLVVHVLMLACLLTLLACHLGMVSKLLEHWYYLHRPSRHWFLSGYVNTHPDAQYSTSDVLLSLIYLLQRINKITWVCFGIYEYYKWKFKRLKRIIHKAQKIHLLNLEIHILPPGAVLQSSSWTRPRR